MKLAASFHAWHDVTAVLGDPGLPNEMKIIN
jgi:hypothetical protein